MAQEMGDSTGPDGTPMMDYLFDNTEGSTEEGNNDAETGMEMDAFHSMGMGDEAIAATAATAMDLPPDTSAAVEHAGQETEAWL